MPSHDTSDTDRRRRQSSDRQRQAHHKKKRSREHRNSHSATSPSEDVAGGSGQRNTLSIDALAQLNEHNTRGANPPEQARRTTRERSQPRQEHQRSRDRTRNRTRERHRRHDYEAVEVQDASPRHERQRSRHHRDSDREHDTPKRERRRGEAAHEHHRSREQRRTRGYGDVDSEFDAPLRDRRRHRRHESDYEESPDRDRHRRKLRAPAAGAMTEDEKRQALFKKKKRVVSGAIVEEGRAVPTMRGGAGNRDTASSYDSLLKEKEVEEKSTPFWRPSNFRWANQKKKRWIIAGVALAILIIIIAVAVAVSKNNAGDTDSKSGDLATVNKDTIPTAARGTYLDPFTWYNTDDLNVTYTNATVGDLPVMGLFSDWDDSTRANDKVPPLDQPWGDYAKKPARGVNVGGWLSLEPFITPSLFAYDRKLGVVDEYTLMKHLGPKTAASTLEKHYATFVNEQTFADIQAAGLDHVRIPFSYWAVEIYDDDPYVFRTSWRYLLRAIEYCRKYGLRVNLDVHGIPGSQNGWNHSGRLGTVGWLNGTDGTLNRQRSLDVHDRLSKFFAQDRYKNIITFYGLANEPRMVDLPAEAVTSWTSDAYNLVRKNGINANVVFGDGFMGLENWQGKLTGLNKLVLDVHQYVIFNKDQIVYTHQKKVQYACDGWTQQTLLSMDTSTGYGPTMFAEWSQADTDCALHLTNVGWGNRWTGTYASGDENQVLTPRCPEQDSSCSCDGANADAGTFSDGYKQFLKMFAEAQMHSFEKGWGWWYWTWDTESAPLWSYKKGLAAGILPAKAYERDFNCDKGVPDFSSMGLAESYKRDVPMGGGGDVGDYDDELPGTGSVVDSVVENRIMLEELVVGI